MARAPFVSASDLLRRSFYFLNLLFCTFAENYNHNKGD